MYKVYWIAWQASCYLIHLWLYINCHKAKKNQALCRVWRDSIPEEIHKNEGTRFSDDTHFHIFIQPKSSIQMNNLRKHSLQKLPKTITKSLDIQILTSVLLTSCIQLNINSFISATNNLANHKMWLPVEKEVVTFSIESTRKKEIEEVKVSNLPMVD